MKNILLSIVFFGILMSASCSYKDDDLLNRSGYSTLGNRNYDKYTDSLSGRLYGFSNGTNSYYGFGGGYAFITNDNFNSIIDGSGRIPDGYNLTYLNFESISAWKSDASSFTWYLDEDYGTVFPEFGSLSANVNGAGFSGKYILWDMTNTDIKEGFVAAQYSPTTGADLKPITIDIYTANEDGSIVFQNSLDSGFALVGIGNTATSSELLWVMAHEMDVEGQAQKDKPFMFVSDNGGESWSEPIEMSAGTDEFNAFAIISEDNLIAYNQEAMLKSTDGGATWDKVEFNFIPTGQELRRISYQRDNDNVLYAVVKKDEDDYGNISDIYRSTDLGESWNKLNSHDIYADNISFYNSPNSGVAVSRGVLQISSDGGVTWRVIMFPFRN